VHYLYGNIFVTQKAIKSSLLSIKKTGASFKALKYSYFEHQLALKAFVLKSPTAASRLNDSY